ncbi:DUF7551 domain-containing protein [Halorubrum ezzemoulense]|uniref:Uncharacterized protein n=1 Tax=Halorubrum ezzemoulense TaxID=337243 RepID=A0A256JBE3_HALEZ|nr:hypothetical protein [Halorubrum ezzemoulense]MDB2223826.1 hypothetical protein [Halorubrum ezzemoulense]MDB9233633.1 hypothetical protein [Halorubrum ezzemoulense]OYR65973.1 hypothetical protein DJ80_00890 [Halorubrum ezzemoulense]OYR72960.1 hypothetical protein DJ76_11145 [Halorubrum ezzemoulense]
MIGTTLLDIADHIESLAGEDGEFSLVCARYGDRPVPAAGLRFEGRETARAAARATEQYRDTLRRYDPELPFYDVIVRQEFAEPTTGTATGDPGLDRFVPDLDVGAADELTDRVVEAVDDRPAEGDRDAEGSDGSALDGDADPHPDAPTRSGPPGRGPRRDRVEFCHAAAAAAFEALSAAGHDRVESAVMDAYFAFAERLSDPDDLCLCLLEATAIALDRHLDPEAQATVLSAAAERLPDPGPTPAADPVAAAFDRLAAVGLVDDYERVGGSERADDPDRAAEAERGATVRVSGYALSPTDGRVPTLPVALEVCRRDPRGRLAGVALLGGGGDATGSDCWFRVDPDAPSLDGGPSSSSVPSES